MEHDLNQKILDHVQESRRRRRRRSAVAALAAVVALATAVALALPALTMESGPAMLGCQLDLHQHGPACYDGEGALACGYADFVVHTHDAACYDGQGRLICPLPEIRAHAHTAACYGDSGPVPTCGLEAAGEGQESPASPAEDTAPAESGHVHTADCYERQLVCPLEEGAGHSHTASDGCYEQRTALTCALPEHAHTDACRTGAQVLTCTETAADHVHGPACYAQGGPAPTCGLEEHAHTDACYAVEQVLVCSLEEQEAHTHGDGCYQDVLTCGQQEGAPAEGADPAPEASPGPEGAPAASAHVHTDDCYGQPAPICGQEEIVLHTHGDGCYDGEGGLACGMVEVREHVHDESCLPPDPAESQPAQDDPLPSESQPAQTSPEPSQSPPAESAGPEPSQSQPAEDVPELLPSDGTSWATAEKVDEKGPVMQFFSALFAAPAGRTDSTDMAEHITSMTVEVLSGGQWVPVGATITSGASIRVTIHYTLPEGAVHEQATVVHYDLPAGIGLNDTAQGTVYHQTSGDPIGTYTISTDGRVTITFFESFAQGGESVTGDLSFQGVVRATGGDGDDTIDLGAAGDTITVEPKEEQTELNLGKVGVYVRDGEDAAEYEKLQMGIKVEVGHLIYTISIYTNSASTDGDITVTDQFIHHPADGVITYDEGNIAISKMTIGPDGPVYSWVPKKDYEIVYHQQTADGGKTSSFTITGLPALGPNEQYQINYTATPHLDTIGGSGYAEVPNQAIAQAGEDEAAAEAKVRISQAMVTKEGYYNEATGNIRWTVYLNQDGRDISGMTFRDVLKCNGQPYDPRQIVNVQAAAYSGSTWKENVTDEILLLLENTENEFSLTFPADLEPPYDTYTYVITYETPIPDGLGMGDPVTFENTAYLEGYHAYKVVTGRVPEPVGYTVVKRSTDVDLNTGTSLGTLSWRTEITYPRDGLELAQLTYGDWIGDIYYDNGAVTTDSHYTTLGLLLGTFHIWNAQGQALTFREDFQVEVVFAEDYRPATAEEAAAYLATGTAWHTVDEALIAGYPNEPISMFRVKFLDPAEAKLANGQALAITYATQIDRAGAQVGVTAHIPNHYFRGGEHGLAQVDTVFHQRLDKQVSPTGDISDPDSYTDDPLTVDLGDSGGRLHYRILLYSYSSGETVVDTLPAGATFDPDSVKVVIHRATGDTLLNTTDRNYILTTSENDGQVTFVLSRLQNYPDAIIGIYYSVDVSGDPAWAKADEGQTITYRNTVTWDGETDSTATGVVNYHRTLEKTAQLLTGAGEAPADVVGYRVVVNPDSRDLVPGQTTIQLSDQIETPAGTGVSLRLETIAVHRYDPDKEGGLGAALSKGDYKADYDPDTGEIQFTLPDSMALVVLYEYEIDRGTIAGNYTIQNTVRLEGQAAISAGDDIVIEHQDSSASANKATLRIYKHEQDNQAKLLSGASFKLERYESDENGEYSWQPSVLTANDNGLFEVGEDGYIELSYVSYIEDDIEGNGGSLYNTLYRLIEVEAPEGYLLDTQPRYFVWMEQGATIDDTIKVTVVPEDEIALSARTAVFIGYAETVNAYIANEPATTSLTVTKLWRDEAGAALTDGLPESIQITLYQHVNGEKVQYVPAEGQQNPVTIMPDPETGDWAHTWTGLPKQIDGQAVTYSVVETAVGGDGTLDGYTVTYQYPEGGDGTGGVPGGTVTVTNTKTTSFVLPETGGTGTYLFLLAGLLLAGAACGGALTLWRRRKGGRAP